MRMHPAEVRLNAYIVTADAIERYLRADAEWSRLSNIFHRIAGCDTRKLKSLTRGKLAEREGKLIADICWAVGQQELTVMFLLDAQMLQVPDIYLHGTESPAALKSGSGRHFKLAPPHLAWARADLVFLVEEWQRWLMSQPEAASSLAQKKKGGRSRMNDDEHKRRYIRELKKNGSLSVREYVLAHDKEIEGANLEAKIRRLQGKIAS
jgi:hypothetical protein